MTYHGLILFTTEYGVCACIQGRKLVHYRTHTHITSASLFRLFYCIAREYGIITVPRGEKYIAFKGGYHGR